MASTTTMTRTQSGGVTVVRLAGPLTHDGVPPVREAFEAAAAGPARLVVDLSDVPVVTTPGLSMLLAAAQQVADAGGRLVVTGATGLVDDLLRRCRLDAVMEIVPDPDEAVRRAGVGKSLE